MLGGSHVKKSLALTCWTLAKEVSHKCSDVSWDITGLIAYCAAGLYATPVGLNVAPNLITVAPYSEPLL